MLSRHLIYKTNFATDGTVYTHYPRIYNLAKIHGIDLILTEYSRCSNKEVQQTYTTTIEHTDNERRFPHITTHSYSHDNNLPGNDPVMKGTALSERMLSRKYAKRHDKELLPVFLAFCD